MTEYQAYRGSPNGKNSNSKSDSKKFNEDDMFDNFCYMVSDCLIICSVKNYKQNFLNF
jgi:hypothetical protein